MEPELRAALEEAARNGNRSLHAEIIQRLEQSFTNPLSIVADSYPAYSPERSKALLKVLLSEELLILQNRINRAGGDAAVLNTPVPELRAITVEEKISGTKQERSSYYSKVVGDTPLTALLTTEEISKIAERLDSLNEAHQQLLKEDKK